MKSALEKPTQQITDAQKNTAALLVSLARGAPRCRRRRHKSQTIEQ